MHNAGIIHGNLTLQHIMVQKPAQTPTQGWLGVRFVGTSQVHFSEDTDDKATDIRTLEKLFEESFPVHHTDMVSELLEGYETNLVGKEEILERLTVSKLHVT